jgi:hypothetical protein
MKQIVRIDVGHGFIPCRTRLAGIAVQAGINPAARSYILIDWAKTGLLGWKLLKINLL